jgi:exonuclease III
MAFIPTSTAIPPLPSAAYRGLLDQLRVAAQSSPTVGAPTVTPTVTPNISPAVAPGAQPIPVLSGLFQQLKDLLARLLSASADPLLETQTPKPPQKPTDLVISSFNVLGSSHTVPGGERPGMEPGPARIRSAVKLLEQHQVDVVGFQELQEDQLREFQKVAGDRYAIYPGFALGKRESVNSIAWRKDKWELVRPGSIEIPYFNGNRRQMPVVRLRNRETGQEAYFANFHNPADTKRFPDQERWRDLATEKQIDLVNRLRKETGLPVFVTGDMNEREEYYDTLTRQTEMVAANSGPRGQRPKQMGIDWIFGSPDVHFSNYTRDRSALVKRTTDHPMIVSKARIDGHESDASL